MIKLIKNTFHNEEDTKKKLADFILKAEILSMGSQTKEFESKFAEKQGREYAVYVNSGSSANLILIQALLNLGRLKKGDRVGFSSLTWSTNVMPIIQLGMTPVPIDCEVDTLNVSSEILKEKIKDIDAFFITNVLGLSSDIDKIKTLCEEEGVLLIEDNCESLGSKVGGVLLGNFGLASTFSFFVGHHLSTIEGGMVCTDDQELYEMLTIVRAHGWGRNLAKDSQEKLHKKYDIEEFYSRYTFYDLGFNVRPTEVQGFLGSCQILYWDEIVRKREENFYTLNKIMLTNPDILNLRTGHLDIFSNFAVPAVFRTVELSRDYRKKFEERGVETRPIIAGNITKQPFYRKYKGEMGDLRNTDFIDSHSFYFGNNPDLTEEELMLLGSLLES